MRVIIVGSEVNTIGLTHSLSTQGFEVVSLSEALDAELLPKQAASDVAVVDGSLKHADAACRNIMQLTKLPVVLLVDSKRTDWKKLLSLGVQGYILRDERRAELAARLMAVSRRCSPKNAGRDINYGAVEQGRQPDIETEET
jgi:DNA-binding response OmpR family regulator